MNGLLHCGEGVSCDCVLGHRFSLFFFSSRRRHTRSLCDWSSDVCSSDLQCQIVITYTVHREIGGSNRKAVAGDLVLPGISYDSIDGMKTELSIPGQKTFHDFGSILVGRSCRLAVGAKSLL